jgi:hypothetical protein
LYSVPQTAYSGARLFFIVKKENYPQSLPRQALRHFAGKTTSGKCSLLSPITKTHENSKPMNFLQKTGISENLKNRRIKDDYFFGDRSKLNNHTQLGINRMREYTLIDC